MSKEQSVSATATVSTAQPGSIVNPDLGLGAEANIVPAAEVVSTPVESAESAESVAVTTPVVATIAPTTGLGFRGRVVSKETHKFKALIYGAHGVGKTLLATSAADVPQMADVLVISAESGSVVAADRFSRTVREIPVNSYDQIDSIYKWLKEHIAAVARKDGERLLALHNLAFPDEPYDDYKKVPIFKTVVIDSISELQKYVMMKILGTGTSTLAVNLSAEPEQARFQEWGKGGDMIRSMLRAFRDLPVHVIFVASLLEKEDEMKRRFFSPNLPGKLGREVQGFVDFVGMMLVANTQVTDDDGATKTVSVRRTIIAPHERWDAKSRLAAHDGLSHFDNARMSDIIKGLV